MTADLTLEFGGTVKYPYRKDYHRRTEGYGRGVHTGNKIFYKFIGLGCQKVHFHCRDNFLKIVPQYLEAMRRIVDRYCGARLGKLACKGNSDLLTP